MTRPNPSPYFATDNLSGKSADLSVQQPGAVKQLLLRELSDLQAQVARMAKTIESVGENADSKPDDARTCGESYIRSILRSRLDRGRFFPPYLFADPAWDMLLELYAAQLGQRRVSVSSLCVASNVPVATASRWIHALEREGLIERQPDPLDRRRFFIALSKRASEAFAGYFSTVAKRSAN